MEYILLFLFGWMVVCLPAIIVTVVANNRRRRETGELSDRITDLTRQLEVLERRSRTEASHEPQASPLAPAGVPAVRISPEETRAAAPVREPVISERPAPTVSVPTLPPPLAVVAPTIASQVQPHSQPKPVEIGGIPLTPAP